MTNDQNEFKAPSSFRHLIIGHLNIHSNFEFRHSSFWSISTAERLLANSTRLHRLVIVRQVNDHARDGGNEGGDGGVDRLLG